MNFPDKIMPESGDQGKVEGEESSDKTEAAGDVIKIQEMEQEKERQEKLVLETYLADIR